MRVSDIMTHTIVTVAPHTTYEEAARILYGNRVASAPVVDLHGRVIGLISEKDLFRAMFPQYGEYVAEPHRFCAFEDREAEVRALSQMPVAAFMTVPAITVDADAPLLKAGGILLAHHLHRLPVVRNRMIVGSVAREDIFRAILQQQLFSLLQKAEPPAKKPITLR